MSNFGDLEKEAEAVEKMKAAIKLLVEAAPYVFQWGDGHGGAMLVEIEKGLKEAGYDFHPPQPKSEKRKAFSKSMSKKVFERDGYRCVKCDSYIDLCVDHIIPVVLGGSDAFENLQTLCRSCNSSKGGRA